MRSRRQHTVVFLLLLLAVFVLFLLDIAMGAVKIPVSEVFKSLFGGTSAKETWDYIILNYRLPKALTAILVGIGLSISGLMMQTLFRNPLAGPYVLGVSSGASLGVAFVVLGTAFLPPFLSTLLLSPYGLIAASCVGSFTVLLAVLLVSQKLRDTMAILIVGLMFASFTSAIVGVLTYFSTAEQLQKFTFWSLGNLGNLSWLSIAILAVCVLVGLFIAVFSIKSLDALLLGENYAKSLGLNIQKSPFLVIISTSIIAGSITAFAGPIAFVGMAVPHIAKMLFQTSSHRVLFWASILLGAVIMLGCDILTQIPGRDIILPINAITSLIGAPVVIWLLLRRKNLMN